MIGNTPHPHQVGMTDTVVVTTPRAETVLFGLGLTIAGTALGYGVRLIADWVAGLRWAPFQGPFELVASIPEPYVTIALPVIGAIVGVVLFMIMISEGLTITLTRHDVELKRGDTTQQIGRDNIGTVFLDRKELVILDGFGAEVGREKSDLKPERIHQAFSVAGYPWEDDGDPFAADYRRWVDGAPALPAGANAVLKARAKALEKGESKDVIELRRELNAIGVVVRDQDKVQHWRPSRNA